MIEELNDYAAGNINLGRLLDDLRGLLGAAGLHDTRTIDSFWDHLAPIDGQHELQTQEWAPPGAFSETDLAVALSSYRAWAQMMLDDPSDQRT